MISRLSLDIKESIALKKDLLKHKGKIIKIINLIYYSLRRGGKILFCGNGGSASDAQHLVAELVVRLNPRKNRRALPAMSLALDTSTLTACGNDIGFDKIFSRSLEALGNKKDVLIVISTSGNSKNILNVLKTAKKMKIKSIGFLGFDGGLAKKLSNTSIVIQSSNVARIQELHIFLGHFILNEVEKKIFKK